MNNEPDNDYAIMPVMDIGKAVDRRNQIVKFVRTIMVENTDFGTIPGTDKPTLLKPGAEKLATFFGLTKRFHIIERVEDFTGENHNGEQFFYYLYRCALHRGDMLVAEADGSCNSFEGKYRYRKAERICPSCGQAAIIKGRSEYGGGWLCFGKKGGCGAKFKDGDTVIESQEVGRVHNPDIADQVNTIQKMSQKRALIAATLLAVNASEFFTQDVEDYIDVEFTPKETLPGVEVRPEPIPPGKPNGNGGNGHTDKPTAEKPYRFPNTASKTFFDAVQKATDNYYDNGPHLLQVIGGWFNFQSQDLWDEKLSTAVDHARNKRQAEIVEVEDQSKEETA